MRSVASVTMCNAFFISTPPTFLAMELTWLEYHVLSMSMCQTLQLANLKMPLAGAGASTSTSTQTVTVRPPTVAVQP